MATALVAAAIAPVASSCGATTKSGRARLSARFVERTTALVAGDTIHMRTVGGFDWTSRIGWSVNTTAGTPGATVRIIQIKDACYERFGAGQWTRSGAAGSACGDEAPDNPATLAKTFHAVASSWKRVGPALVDGVPTTHYAGSMHIGAAVAGPFELWLDKQGVVRRLTAKSNFHGRTVSRLDYYDFGVKVRVKAPSLEGAN